MALVNRSLTIDAQTPAESRRADRAVQMLLGTSRRRTQALFDNECISLNGKLFQEPWRQLIDGEMLEVNYDADQNYEMAKKPPKYLGFEILFEDEHLIVVNKPAAWLTVPTEQREQNTLVHRVSDYLTKKNRGRRVLVYPAHRLDRGVSGVLVLGKSLELCAALRKQFEQHKPARIYSAVVAGMLPKSQGTFRSHLTTDAQLTRHSTDDAESGELAITHYQVEREFADTSQVRIQLETGRRNQIRVHFAEAGHPVLGDPRYGREQSAAPALAIRSPGVARAAINIRSSGVVGITYFYGPDPR